LRAERPQISARPLAARELGAYRNLALSPFNVRGAAGVFPHTSTDSEGGDDWQVDFGREVEIDKVVVLLRADLPRDEHRRQLTFLFSDGGRHTVALEKTPRTQTFTLEPRITTWLRLADLVQDEAGRGAIAGIEVWGRDPIAVGDDLAAAPPASP